MVKENKTKKYLLYASGEIILVVIGILIALQINNWNENRKNRSLEHIFISRLLDDIKEEESFILTYIDYNNKVRDFTKRVNEHFINPELALKTPKQSLIDFYQASQYSDVRQTASTYKELNTSGQINLIRNDDLRTALISFYELDWSNSNIFNHPKKYRENLRSLMPSDIQNKIRANCGDIYIKTKSSIAVKLPNNCQIELNDDIAKIALKNLLNDSELKKNLNFLIGNIHSKLGLVKNIKGKLKELKIELEENKQ
ncbi:DUF6090 family protein [Psychroserpens sp. AS72]|uniref:DUF6090 family protein n=1 Tax=Psychroserpens sp. AS72 TaxID=3135775 RepID=UPI00316D4BE8